MAKKKQTIEKIEKILDIIGSHVLVGLLLLVGGILVSTTGLIKDEFVISLIGITFFIFGYMIMKNGIYYDQLLYEIEEIKKLQRKK